MPQLVQNGVNLRAIVAQMLRDIDAMRQSQNLDGCDQQSSGRAAQRG
jgi:hypothetical protein